MTEPPEYNPATHMARTKRHWGARRELKPGVWLVEEGSGPKAVTRRHIILIHRPLNDTWMEWGRFDPQYGFKLARLVVPWQYNGNNREYKMHVPRAEAPELYQMLIDLATRHA